MTNFNLPHLASVVGTQALPAIQQSMALASPNMQALSLMTAGSLEEDLNKRKAKPALPEGMPIHITDGYDQNTDFEDFYDDLSVSWWEDTNKAKLGGYGADGLWHGASRIPSAPNAGLMLKLIGPDSKSSHDTYILGLLGELHYTDRQGNYTPNKLYRKNEGYYAGRYYSFPKNQKVDPNEFTALDQEEIWDLLDRPYNYDMVSEYILPNEVIKSTWDLGDRPGKRGDMYYAYPDSGKDKYLTIGIGHLVDPRQPSSITFTNQQLAAIGAENVTAEDLYKGNIGLTESQIMELFVLDIRRKTRDAEKEFPHLYSYPDYVQAAIIDGYFWGMLPLSGKTRGHIHKALEDPEELLLAADEFIRNKTYRRGENRPRFHRFQEVMRRWHTELTAEEAE